MGANPYNARAVSTRPPELQHEQAIAKYRNAALRYDSFMARTLRWRRQAVEALALEPGQTVLDVACGTGANFDLILEQIGPQGRLIGLDLSGEMLSVAKARVRNRITSNVELLEASAEDVELTAKPDRALFSFTHDVLQSPVAVENIAGQLAERARVAAVGSKRASRWNLPLNAITRMIASRYVTSFRNFERPWTELERVAELRVETFALGAVYLAWGSAGETRAPR